MKKKKKTEKMVLIGRERYRHIYRKPTNHDWLFVLTGTEEDKLKFIIAMIFNPLFVYVAIYLFTAKEASLLLLYVMVDGCVIYIWIRDALREKEYMEWVNSDHYMQDIRTILNRADGHKITDGPERDELENKVLQRIKRREGFQNPKQGILKKIKEKER